MKSEDSKIKSLFKVDEEKAFKLIFDQYYSNLCAIAYLYIHDNSEAEEVVQQLFIKIWEGKHYQNISKLKSYLITGVKNSCINYLEKKKTEQYRLDQLPSQEETIQSLEFLLDVEARSIFDQAVLELPKQGRKAIELVYFSNLTYNDAALKLGVSVNTVKSHLKTALQKLRSNRRLKQYFSEKR